MAHLQGPDPIFQVQRIFLEEHLSFNQANTLKVPLTEDPAISVHNLTCPQLAPVDLGTRLHE
jgi:hypothetical protein